MTSRLWIGARVTLATAFVLAVFFVPLVHASHYHAGDGHGDSSIHATCAVCSFSHAGVAVGAAHVDLDQNTHDGPYLSPASTSFAPSFLYSAETTRAPPSSPA